MSTIDAAEAHRRAVNDYNWLLTYFDRPSLDFDADTYEVLQEEFDIEEAGLDQLYYE